MEHVKLKPHDLHLPDSRNHYGNFVESVRTQRDPVGTIEAAVRSDIISHVSDIAIRYGRKVVWDPVRQRFVADDEAVRRMRRAWRQPWRLAR